MARWFRFPMLKVALGVHHLSAPNSGNDHVALHRAQFVGRAKQERNPGIGEHVGIPLCLGLIQRGFRQQEVKQAPYVRLTVVDHQCDA